ncbi:hypothetical protein LIP_3280 [Limnochorda pilosa]|uniref:Uncharacterized protein n=1 Tax=Limnochorda pilosa TaxID=1555112 RepID=A0A0K2SQ08_LIMPI|nr:hypothetical protein LIP_3280 [Limnochorda pilosa]
MSRTSWILPKLTRSRLGALISTANRAHLVFKSGRSKEGRTTRCEKDNGGKGRRSSRGTATCPLTGQEEIRDSGPWSRVRPRVWEYAWSEKTVTGWPVPARTDTYALYHTVRRLVKLPSPS